MATYKNNGGELVFPTLFDADGNVLVVAAGATFETSELITLDGVVPVSAKKAPKATASDAPEENATEQDVAIVTNAVETKSGVTDAGAPDAVDPSTLLGE